MKAKCPECQKPLLPGCPFCKCGWPFQYKQDKDPSK